MKTIRLGNEEKNISFSSEDDNNEVDVIVNDINNSILFKFKLEDLKVALRFLTEGIDE